MQLYFIFFFYVLIAGTILHTSGQLDTSLKRLNNTPLWAAIIIVFVPTLYVGLRSGYNDTYAYIIMFNNFDSTLQNIMASMSTDRGIGWSVYEWFIKSYITQNATTFLMITAVIQMGAIIKLYRNYSTNYGLSMLLFFISMCFVNLMGGVRQMMAATLIFYFSDLLFEGKNIRFLIVIFFAFTIHFSALIWIPIMFAVKGRTFGLNTLLIGLITVIIVVYINRFTDLLTTTLEDTLYEGYTEQFVNDDGSNIIHALIAAIPVIIAFIGNAQLRNLDDKRINILVNLSVINLMLNILAHYTSGILIGRLPMYLDAYTYALYPILFDTIFEKNTRQFVSVASVVGYLTYGCYYIYTMGFDYTSQIMHF